MVYVKHAGTEAQQGQYLERDICCLVQEVDPQYFSKLPMVEATGDSIVLKPQPPQPPKPPPEEPVAETEDVSSVDIENVAQSNIKAAEAINGAMDNLVDAAKDLAHVNKEKLQNKIVSMHHARSEKIASTIKEFASKQQNLLKSLKQPKVAHAI